MTMTSPLPLRFPLLKTWRTIAIGLATGVVTPAFADNLPEVQRLIKQGQYPQALEKVDAYLADKPKDAQGRFLKGLIYTETNKPTEAIATFTRLTEDYPELPEPYNNLAVLYAQQKQYEKARTSLEMAIRTHPSYAIAYENLGDVYAKLASQAYDKALQLDSVNATTQIKMALIRDLITTSSKGNVKPTASASTPAVAAATPVAASKQGAQPASAPNTSVVASTPGAAAVAPKIVEPKAAAPVAAAAPEGTAADDVSKTIANWANAWSRKDVKGYFAQYAADFKTPKGQSRKAWENERSDRISGKPGTISVSYDEPEISINGDRATAKFRQHYKSSGLSGTTTKTLVLVRTGNRWLIQEEIAR